MYLPPSSCRARKGEPPCKAVAHALQYLDSGTADELLLGCLQFQPPPLVPQL